tara:strand:+ start:165 stop:557 length:393 start_codon:yes stop_codon:yes gene_type:complete
MKNYSAIAFVLILLVSCGDNTQSNKGPSFGYHVDRIVRVNEGSTEIGAFIASDLEGDEISYSISNIDMDIAQDGVVTFNIVPDFETQEMHSAIVIASNDGGSDEINLTVYINDSDCEFDSAATFDNCRFH